MRALLGIEADNLRRNAPIALLDLVGRARSMLSEPDGGG